MRYAEVSVNSPIARRQTFSYEIPAGLDLAPGHAVWVPFGQKVLQGIVLDLPPYPAVAETREILGTIEPQPVLSTNQIPLARWLSAYYLAPLFDCVALMLPPGFERNAVTWLRPGDSAVMSNVSEEAAEVLRLVRERGRLSPKELEKRLGQKKASRLVSSLVARNLLYRDYTMAPPRVSVKTETCLRLAPPCPETTALTPKQADVIAYLSRQSAGVTPAQVNRDTGVSRAIIAALVKKGLVIREEVAVPRDPFALRNIQPSFPLPLTPAQEKAFQPIRAAIREGQGKVFLLHGVTGSGKTEIYLQALAETVREGRRGILLVPEISLTPQTTARVAARFPGQVAILHSRLSLGEQFDQWHRIRRGECAVVIGSRSALFAPQPDLGLIVIDEEHEWTYKQHDTSPRYHARTAALKLAELNGVSVILGSATPDVESYYHAQRGDYQLLEMPERVTPTTAMPQVEIVDMREELKAGNRSLFSRALREEIGQTAARQEQAILFLNRRGGATFIQCRHCGFVLHCRRCDNTLTFHPVEDVLTCHQCNYHTAVPSACPRCHGQPLKFLGFGTQRLEQETQEAFPEIRKLRWDSDATRGKDSHEAIMAKFRNREADMLIGTQMLAKGLDLPGVTLVGVVSADTALNLPDFRAGERTFQLLSQVAGRAGRGGSPGKVFIQTFSPEHYAIQAAARHDYLAFYRRELDYRRQLHNPPFRPLASLVYLHVNDAACEREARRMKAVITAEVSARGTVGMEIVGPAPAFRRRVRGRYRWQLVLRGTELSALLDVILFPQGWSVDIDPVSLI
ncbi:MAG: primosomal protein N' [Chloroflexota bacterium]